MPHDDDDDDSDKLSIFWNITFAKAAINPLIIYSLPILYITRDITHNSDYCPVSIL